ncbi:hypothetical protein [Sphingobacterium anhuiense]|uniref:DUF4397 domain-containing protein n=1 Tax=Sphingobacterium anhuiense TaxID=493780 RepID=A0ABW5YWX0_9SPHI
MKIYYIKYSILFLFVVLLFACKRDDLHPKNVPLAKVMVFNGIVEGGNIKVSVSPQDKSWSSIPDAQFSFNRLTMIPFLTPSGVNIVKAVQLADTTKIFYRNHVTFQNNNFYTLYLTGTATKVDTLFRKEVNLPIYVPLDVRKKLTAQDSMINIRFINLSYNGPKININIKNKNTNEVSDLDYQKFSNFKVVSAIADEIVFEIRNAADQSLLLTYSLNARYFRFKTVDFAIVGSYGNPNVPYFDQYSVAINSLF